MFIGFQIVSMVLHLLSSILLCFVHSLQVEGVIELLELEKSSPLVLCGLVPRLNVNIRLKLWFSQS